MRSLIRNSLILLGLLWLTHRFQRWRQRLLYRLTRRSHVVQTVHGEIEYILRGTGDATVLLIHGSPGGCDFWRLYQDVIDAGYRILCPSRPGYLRTPLTSGQSLGEQSQLCIALLDTLQIKQVAVIGFSGGAPLAFQLTIDAPHRIQSMVIESGVTHRINIANTPEEWLLNLSSATVPLQRPLYWLVQRIVHALPGVTLWLTFWFTTSHSWTGIWHCMQHILHNPRQLRAFWRLFDANLPFSQRQAGYANDIRTMENPTNTTI